jgi:hypothetical protein
MIAFLFGSMAARADVSLVPAQPQPDPSSLQQGLAVTYAYPTDVKSLSNAEHHLTKSPFKGKPIVGFDYPDTDEGDLTMTSRQPFMFAAKISGFIRFDAAGSHVLDFETNDGLSVSISGQEVYEYDGRHVCSSSGEVTVTVPEAGWYPLEATYFQRSGTACLLMKWATGGAEPDWTPNEAFAFIPE